MERASEAELSRPTVEEARVVVGPWEQTWMNPEWEQHLEDSLGMEINAKDQV